MFLENPVIDILGWIGAAAVLTAYGLVSSSRLTGTARSYQTLNAIGSILLTVNTYYYRAYPSAFVNVLWLAIALWGLTRRLDQQPLNGKREA